VLASILIDAVDETLDAVPAEASVLMVGGPYTHADLHYEIAEVVILCGQARVREPATTPCALGHLTPLRPSLGERPLGDSVVDAREIVATQNHVRLRILIAASSARHDWPSSDSSKRLRRVVLASVVIDAIDETLEAMLAPTAAVMAGRS